MKQTFFNKRRGFTLIELLVVIFVLGILAIMLVPALCQSKTTSHGMECMNNQKQIVLAAKMYAEDYQDNWVPNFPGQTPSWVAGNMGNGGDATNTALLIDPKVSVLGPYVRNPSIYHCPADTSTRINIPRVRSVSMSQAVGTVGKATANLPAGSPVNGQWLTGSNIGDFPQTVWRTYGKTSSMTDPGPALLWVFLDEQQTSINDGGFAVQMQFTGPFATIIDFPGSYHNGGCGMSFADGHSEIHKWLGSTIKQGGLGNAASGTVAGDSANDVTWLQSHTSAHM